MWEQVVRTWVSFRLLQEKQISDYLANVDVLDKAGAYALQERSHEIIERIEGSRTNVIGLPMETVMDWMRRHKEETDL